LYVRNGLPIRRPGGSLDAAILAVERYNGMLFAESIHSLDCLTEAPRSTHKGDLLAVRRPSWLILVCVRESPLLRCAGSHIYGPNVITALESPIGRKGNGLPVWREARFTIISMAICELFEAGAVRLENPDMKRSAYI
jgi:hypothetical protein